MTVVVWWWMGGVVYKRGGGECVCFWLACMKRNEMRNEVKMGGVEVFVLDKVLNKINPPLTTFKLKRPLRERRGFSRSFLLIKNV